jgi:hypothetical protein
VARPSSHNLAVALAEAPAPSRVRRPGRRIPALPLLLSGIIHVLVICAAALVVWRTAIAPSIGSPGAGVAFETAGEAPAASAPSSTSASTTAAPANASSFASTASEGSLAPLFSPSDTDTPLAGLTTGASPRPSPSALGSFVGSSLASGSLFTGGSGASTSPAAVAGGAGGATTVTFGGLGASSVSSVVYAVDCSGPMVTSLPMVINELERSVGRLTSSQRFGVVLFRRATDGGPGAESFASVLVRATPSAKELLHNWLAAAEPSGRSSPLAGVELALALKPDAVFLLSRAIQRSGGGVWELGLDATMAKLEQLNPSRPGLLGTRRPVLIQTIQFLDEDPTGIMQTIGTRHGGGAGYRVVKRQQDLISPDPLKP